MKSELKNTKEVALMKSLSLRLKIFGGVCLLASASVYIGVSSDKNSELPIANTEQENLPKASDASPLTSTLSPYVKSGMAIVDRKVAMTDLYRDVFVGKEEEGVKALAALSRQHVLDTQILLERISVDVQDETAVQLLGAKRVEFQALNDEAMRWVREKGAAGSDLEQTLSDRFQAIDRTLKSIVISSGSLSPNQLETAKNLFASLGQTKKLERVGPISNASLDIGKKVIPQVSEDLLKKSPLKLPRYMQGISDVPPVSHYEMSTESLAWQEPLLQIFAGDMVHAAPPAAPLAQATSCEYDPADVADALPEVDIDHPKILALAEQLNYSPVEIYAFVRNNIVYEPTNGSIKGAVATLESGSGNDIDQASLLVALLRASKVPARFVHSLIVFAPNDERLVNWLGVKTWDAALERLSANEEPYIQFGLGGSIVAYGIDHVFVESCVPYDNYRASGGDLKGHRWIPLDPSYKKQELKQGSVVPAGFSFDYNSYLSVRTNKTVEDELIDQLEGQLGESLSGFGYEGRIIKEDIQTLPSSLPHSQYALSPWGGDGAVSVSRIPDSYRVYAEIEVRNVSSQLLVPKLTVDLPEILSKRFTLSFEGVSGADQQRLENWSVNGGALPCSITSVTPKLRLDGMDITPPGVSGSIDVCDQNNQLSIQVFGRGQSAENALADGFGVGAMDTVIPASGLLLPNIAASNLYAMQVYAANGSESAINERADKILSIVGNQPDPSSVREELLGEYLHVVGQRYMLLTQEANKKIGRLFNTTADDGYQIGNVFTARQVEYLFDIPLGVSSQGLYLDIPSSNSKAIDIETGQINLDAFHLLNYAGSFYESYVWQADANLDAVSTVRGLQFASEQGNIRQELFSLSDVDNKLNQGCPANVQYTSAQLTRLRSYFTDTTIEQVRVSAPTCQIIYEDWQGAVSIAEYKFIDREAYKHDFILDGGYVASGGATVGGYYVFTYDGTSPDPSQPSDIGIVRFLPPELEVAVSQFDKYETPSTFAGTSTGRSILYGTEAGDPVNMVSGNMYHTETDFVLKGRGGLPIIFQRYYNSSSRADGPLGFGWTHSFNHHLRFYDENGDGSTDNMVWVNGTGGISGYNVANINDVEYTPIPGLYTAAGRESNGEYGVREKNGFRYYFENVAGTHEQRANLLRVEDRRGNTLSLTYDAAGRLDTVSDDLGRVIDFQYDGASTHIARIVDWDNRVFRYSYTDDNLIKYESPEAVAGNKAAMTYNYYTATDGTNLDHAMKSFTKPNGNSMTFEYYTNGRVFRHINSEGKAYNFRYNPFRRESTTLDERGISETFLFNEYGLPVEHTLGDGTRMRYEYTDVRHPLSETARINELGYRTESFYDDDANLVRMRMPDGSEIQYLDYNQFHQPGRIIDQRGNTTLYKYDSEGNRTQTIALKQGVTASAPNAGQVIAWMLNSYDDHGNLLKSKTARDFAQVSQNAAFDSVPGPYMEYVYGANALHPEEVRRCGLQHSAAGTLENRCVSAAQTFDVLGRPLQAANAALYTGEMRYDDDDRVVQMTNGIRRWQDLSYDDNDNLIASSLQGKNSLGEVSLLAFASAEYDSLDRPIRKGNLAGHASDMQYDPIGNLLKMTDPDGYTISFEYDQRNRPLKAFDKQGNAVSTRYDNAGRPLEVTDPNGNTRRMVYYGTSENGRLQSSTLPDNRSLTYFYDDNGNVIRTVDNGNRESLMQYDALDRVVRSVGPLHDGVEGLNIRAVMTYQYNELGQQTAIYAGYTNAAADPDSDSLQLQASYSYDDFGRQIGMTDALGETTQAFYDDYGNPIKQIKSNGHIVEMTYDHARNGLLIQRTARLNATDPNPIVTFWKHDDLGRVIEVDDTFADYQYEYDRAGNLVKVSDLRGDKTLFYSFSPGKLLNEISDSDGRSRQYLYDAVGRMSTIRTNSGIRANFSYDAGGRLEERQVFRTPGRGIRTRYEYDSADKLLSVVNRTVSLNGAFTTFSRHTYQYDDLGRKTLADQKIADFDAQGDFFLRDWDFSYQYDALNRLIDVQRNGALDEAFTYDVYDNRRSRQTTTANTQYSYDSAHQLNEAVTTESGVSNSTLYRYDEAGNLLKRCGGTIASQSATDCSGSDELVLGYDALDRTVQSQRTGETSQNYIYSYDGNRIELQEGSTKRRYVYDGLDIWSEFGSDWQAEALAHMTYAGLDMPLLREDYEDGRDYHYLPDGMGSIAARVFFKPNDPNFAITSSYFYDTWGTPDSLSSSSAPRFGYTGREHDGHGLIYSRARFYDPAIGRFNQRDPMGFIDGVNQYAYVGMSPTNFTDPLGLAKVNPGFVLQSNQTLGYVDTDAVREIFAAGKARAVSWGYPEALLNAGDLITPAMDGVDAWRAGAFGGVALAVGESVLGRGKIFKPVVDQLGGFDRIQGLLPGFGGGASSRLSGFTYRGDSRPPEEIFANGFQPRGKSWDLYAHALDNRNPPSMYISTSRSADEAAGFASNVYVVRPINGVDVNRSLGDSSPLPYELEIAIPGGVNPSDIRGVTQGNVSTLNPRYKR